MFLFRIVQIQKFLIYVLTVETFFVVDVAKHAPDFSSETVRNVGEYRLLDSIFTYDL